MSIVTAVYLPEGIILAGDSRLTGTKTVNQNEEKIKKEFTISDNAQKVMMLSKCDVGVASCGDAMIEGMTVADYIRKFEIDFVEETDTVEQIANKLCSKINGKNVLFFVCGYEKDEPNVFVVTNSVVRENKDTQGNLLYGATWKGRTKAISRLINAEPKTKFNWGLMPLKDGVDFAEYIVDTTIKYERFEDDIQTCGGPIDILVIKKDQAFWYKHKIYKP